MNNSFSVPDDVSLSSTVIDQQIDQGSVEVDKEISEKTSEIEINYDYGEHLVCVWTDDVGEKMNWHLGVVDKYENGELFVSYMKRTDKKGFNWLFPEEAEIHLTKHDQVIARNIPVRYSLTAMMRCILDDKPHTDITQCYQNLIG